MNVYFGTCFRKTKNANQHKTGNINKYIYVFTNFEKFKIFTFHIAAMSKRL